MSMGKISKRPMSMARERTTLLRGEKAAKFPIGPTSPRPGPTLLRQVSAAAGTAEHEQDAGALDAARRAAGAAAQEHEADQDELGQDRPLGEVRRGEAGGGDHRCHLEPGVPQGVAGSFIGGQEVPKDQSHGPQNGAEEEAQLVAFERLPEPAGEEKEMMIQSISMLS